MSRAALRKEAVSLAAENDQLRRLLRISRNGLAMARLHIWENEAFAASAEAVRKIDRAMERSDPDAFGNVISPYPDPDEGE